MFFRLQRCVSKVFAHRLPNLGIGRKSKRAKLGRQYITATTPYLRPFVPTRTIIPYLLYILYSSISGSRPLKEGRRCGSATLPVSAAKIERCHEDGRRGEEGVGKQARNDIT